MNSGLAIRVMAARGLKQSARWPRAAGYAVCAVAVGMLVGVAAALLPPVLTAALVPAALLAWWMAVRPEMGLLLLMAITGGLINYDQLPYLSLGPISLHVTDLILLYLLVVAVIRLLIQRDFKYVRTPLDAPLLSFYALAALSVGTAIVQFHVQPNIAIREFRIVTYWLAFFAVTQLIRTPRQLATLFNGLVVLAVLMTAFVTLQMIVPSLPLVRVSSETLVTAGRESAGVSRVWITGERLTYVMLIVAVCVALLTPAVRTRRVFGLVTAGLLVWLLLSFQRNYWFTTAVALGLLALVVKWPDRLRALRWGIFAALVLTVALSIPGNPLLPWAQAALDRATSVQADTLAYDTSAILRETEIQYGLRKVAEYPLFGVGIGNDYRPWIRRFDYFPGAVTSHGLIWYCHNAYLWIWVKMGTAALLCFLWLCGTFVWRGWRRWARLPDPKWRAITLGFTLAFIGQMLSNLVAPNFIQNWVLIVFPMVMGINELQYKWHHLG